MTLSEFVIKEVVQHQREFKTQQMDSVTEGPSSVMLFSIRNQSKRPILVNATCHVLLATRAIRKYKCFVCFHVITHSYYFFFSTFPQFLVIGCFKSRTPH